MHPSLIAQEINSAGPIAVLDKGHVHLLDVMGSDASIASDARASHGHHGEPRSAKDDRWLIRRLMRDRHTSPFEMAELKFHIAAPVYVARQWVRHRMANWSEQSGRYTVLPPDDFQRTAPDAWRLQDQDNKQGSAGFLSHVLPDNQDDGGSLSFLENHLLVAAQKYYQIRLDAGIAREQARKDLPLSTYTRWVWKIDLHNLLHFLALRLAPDAQLEIRQYAQVIAGIVGRLFPGTWEEFVDYRLEAMTLSRAEQKIVSALIHCGNANDYYINEAVNYHIRNDREKTEFRAKLIRLGLVGGTEGGEA